MGASFEVKWSTDHLYWLRPPFASSVFSGTLVGEDGTFWQCPGTEDSPSIAPVRSFSGPFSVSAKTDR